MATSISGTSKVTLSISSTLAKDVDLSTASHRIAQTITESYTNGTAANQCNMQFIDTRSTSGNDDLDFAGGLTNAFGDSITFTSVKLLYIKAADANTTNVVIGAEGTNPFASMFGDASDTLVLPPGAFVCLSNPGATGFAVTAGTGDKLRIAPSSGTVAYDIIVLGEV